MTEKPAQNIAASVRQRLLNLRETQGQDDNTLLMQYAIEWFLYRLSRSELAERFVLKGFMQFHAIEPRVDLPFVTEKMSEDAGTGVLFLSKPHSFMPGNFMRSDTPFASVLESEAVPREDWRARTVW